MELITLNTWGGRVHEPLLKFFEKNNNIDIFCLQEINKNAKTEKVDPEYIEDALQLYNEIENILTEHVGYFRPHIEDWYGLAIFIKKEIKISDEGDLMIYDIDYKGGG